MKFCEVEINKKKFNLAMKLILSSNRLGYYNYFFYLFNQVLNHIAAVKHGGTMQGCHFLGVRGVEADELFPRLQFEHEPHNFECPLRAG